MPVDWDAFDKDLEEAIEKGAKHADEKLASRISALTRMTAKEVAELFPEPADVQKLARLMQIVKSADDRNAKINQIVRNAEDFAGVVLTLLGKFV